MNKYINSFILLPFLFLFPHLSLSPLVFCTCTCEYVFFPFSESRYSWGSREPHVYEECTLCVVYKPRLRVYSVAQVTRPVDARATRKRNTNEERKRERENRSRIRTGSADLLDLLATAKKPAEMFSLMILFLYMPFFKDSLCILSISSFRIRDIVEIIDISRNSQHHSLY